jgi:hypothetical protein
MLSEGFSIDGRWDADTLHGRAHVFSDVMGWPTPRANAYGVRFRCRDPQARAAALTAILRLQQRDEANPALGQREDSLADAAWRRRAPR